MPDRHLSSEAFWLSCQTRVPVGIEYGTSQEKRPLKQFTARFATIPEIPRGGGFPGTSERTDDTWLLGLDQFHVSLGGELFGTDLASGCKQHWDDASHNQA